VFVGISLVLLQKEILTNTTSDNYREGLPALRQQFAFFKGFYCLNAVKRRSWSTNYPFTASEIPFTAKRLQITYLLLQSLGKQPSFTKNLKQ